jgi:hypothetical protein
MLKEAIRCFLNDPKCPCESISDQKEIYIGVDGRLLQLSIYKKAIKSSPNMEIVGTDMMIAFFDECFKSARKSKNSFFDSELRVYNYFNGTVGIQFGFIEKSDYFLFEKKINDEDRQKKYILKVASFIRESKENGRSLSEITSLINHLPSRERQFILNKIIETENIATIEKKINDRKKRIYMSSEYIDAE